MEARSAITGRHTEGAHCSPICRRSASLRLSQIRRVPTREGICRARQDSAVSLIDQNVTRGVGRHCRVATAIGSVTPKARRRGQTRPFRRPSRRTVSRSVSLAGISERRRGEGAN